LPALLPEGRLVELSGTEGTSARTTVAIALVARAQQEGQPCAWIQLEGDGLFPPDLVERGIDLDALVVVHVPCTAGVAGLARAAELVLRSGGFGCVVVDMMEGEARGAGPSSRLAQLAREHEAWLVVLTEKPRTHGSLGPLVGVRADVKRTRAGRLFHVSTEVMKDKSGIGLDPDVLACEAPLGAG
jgi:recombination protein RecA